MEHIYDSVFSARLDHSKSKLPKTTLLAFIELYREDASALPPDDDVALIFSVDMNCNFYGNLDSIAKMAELLECEDADLYERMATEIKRRIYPTDVGYIYAMCD